jgi:uncharacterized protein YycO
MRLKKNFILALFVILYASFAYALPKVQEGDIIFQTSKSAQSLAIQKATQSRYSHVGVILNYNGSLCVFEAIKTVSCTPLREWIERGENAHYVLKRIKSRNILLIPENTQRFRKLAKSLIGLPYDLTFEWSDSKMYCSELVWKLYDRALGIKIGNLSKEVKQKIIERYQGKPPLNEVVISPEEIFNSPLLVEIKPN